MDRELFRSIVALTEARDTPSLEWSLAVTLAEFIPLKTFTIFFREKEQDSYRASVSLQCNDQGLITPVEHPPEALPEVKDLDFHSGKPATRKIGDQLTEYWFPVAATDDMQVVFHLRSKPLSEEQRFLTGGLSKVFSNYLEVIRLTEQDRLTGLLNRRAFEQHMHFLFRASDATPPQHLVSDRRAGNSDENWCVIMDIDHFKQVNDRFGHVCGDEVLLSFSYLMQRNFRGSDLLFRFGGEEFVVILRDIEQAKVSQKLDAFRDSVAKHEFPLAGQITVTIGYTQLISSLSPLVALERADKALYYGKDHGRNRVEFFESLVEQGELSARQSSGDIELF